MAGEGWNVQVQLKASGACDNRLQRAAGQNNGLAQLEENPPMKQQQWLCRDGMSDGRDGDEMMVMEP